MLGPLTEPLTLVDNVLGDTIAEAAYINDKYLGGMVANITLLSMALISLHKSGRAFPRTKNTFEEEYDYIIVGGGTAGSVMANRLSQKPCVSVLLLEAGGQPSLLTEVPASIRLLTGTNIDWLYQTTPQEYCCSGQNERRVNWNSGKALGGSSILNSMIYVRGNKRNYDDWEAEGCTGWSYDDVLPYFKKLEDHTNIDEVDEGFHGVGGPMTIEKINYVAEFKELLLKATAAMGYELTDSNGRRQTGIYDFQGTLRNSQRCSTAKAYLVPADDRENLTILKGAFARKIVMEGTKATGVEFDFLGQTSTVKAKKEVIISSGTTRTPQILMLSGIGPKEELEKFGIPVVVDRPAVGQNLQDHFASQLNFVLDPLIPNIITKLVNPLTITDYIFNRSGPWAGPSQVQLIAFLNGINTTATSPDYPYQELYFVEFSTLEPIKNLNLKPEVIAQYAPYTGIPMYSCVVSTCDSCSVGEITLRSDDPYDPPIINPNYYKCKRDLDDVVEGLKICYAIGTSEEMKKIGAKVVKLFPHCGNMEGNLTAFFECYARTAVSTFWHPTGTARMGQPDDPRSVVDPQLRVIGTTGLRVINAAIMPNVISGNTNVPTMMVAEKAYDVMKDDIQCDEDDSRQDSTCRYLDRKKK